MGNGRLLKCLFGLTVFFLSTSFVQGEQVFPKPGWKDEPDPIASPYARPGGQLSFYIGPSPKSLNYLVDNNVISAEFFNLTFETFLTVDPLTYELVPGLAEKWVVSDDQKTIRFHLNPRARWSDGKPITTEDVLWTYDAIMNPDHMTGIHKVSLEKFHRPVALDLHTVEFKVKEVHFKNLYDLGGAFFIMAKHEYSKKDFNKISFDFPVVSGPYRFGDFKEGLSLVLERRDDFWKRYQPGMKGVYNFDRLVLKFFENQENAYEAFRKGEIDVLPVTTSRRWVQEMNGEEYDKSWIVKQKVTNFLPVSLQGFVMNMREFPFDDVRVRKAMAHMVNREKMNETLMYKQYDMHKAYWEDIYDRDHPASNKPLPFNKEAAQKLLAEAGWKANPATGILEKNGKPFSVEFLMHSKSSEKFINIYREDLKDVGIDLNPVLQDWAAWLKRMGKFEYQMTWASWRSVVLKNPEPMWHSKEADREEGNNVARFAIPEVDVLIEKHNNTFDLLKRNEILRKIDQMIFDQHPYALLWYMQATRVAYWNKFGVPPTVLSKFGDEFSVLSYWWADSQQEATLENAMEKGRLLPRPTADIFFEEELRNF